MKHIPVLLDSVLDALGDINGKSVVDCTFGAGGYTRAFLERGAIVTAFDRDPNVVADAKEISAQYGDKFTFVPSAFSELSELGGQYDAIVFDLGISSMQIDVAERGFSFRSDAPLDMRMDTRCETTAAQLIEKLSVPEIAQVLREYGDIRNAMQLACVIKDKSPQTTFELKNLIKKPNDIAPVFQSLRMALNDEMGEIRRALTAVPDLLKCGGKCICVTFHSIEDRFVKNIFRDWITVPGDPRMPTVAKAPFVAIKAVLPDKIELKNNSRARSAHMRGVIKSC